MSDKPLTNLEKQSIVVAAILDSLLRGGIVADFISAQTFVSAFKEAGYPDRFDADGLLEDLIAWLEREGIVFVKNAMDGTEGEMLWECSLTAKGLQLLQTPNAIFGGMTPKEVIEGKAKGDAPASSYVKAGSFLGGLFGGVIKTLSG